jgi:tripartite-type tricarboxylate transporter receptor subunit TctC
MMKQPTRAFFFVALLFAAHSFVSVPCGAEDYPSRPIRWLVGYPAGGGSDLLSRVVAEEMAKNLGQPIVIENRPGASGNIAAAALSQSAADGYTVLMADRSTIVLNPVLFKSTGFDAHQDFASVGMIAQVPMVLAIGQSANASSLPEFIALAKSQPGELSYSSPGPGTQQELTFEIFQQNAGIKVNVVRYRGGPQPMLDVAQGRIAATVAAYPNLPAFLSNGSLRAIAVAQKTRFPALADVPTFEESGIGDLDSPIWYGLFTRRGTPADVVRRLEEELSRALKTESVVKRIAATGWVPEFGTSQKLEAVIQKDQQVWPPAIKRLGVTVQ